MCIRDSLWTVFHSVSHSLLLEKARISLVSRVLLIRPWPGSVRPMGSVARELHKTVMKGTVSWLYLQGGTNSGVLGFTCLNYNVLKGWACFDQDHQESINFWLLYCCERWVEAWNHTTKPSHVAVVPEFPLQKQPEDLSQKLPFGQF